jgi:hypothetical protein
MPIKYQDVPEAAVSALNAALEALVRDGSYVVKTLQGRDAASVKPGRGHPVHGVTMHDLIGAGSEPHFPLVAWEFLLSDGPEVIAIADVVPARGHDGWQFAHINVGPFVRSIDAALTSSEDRLGSRQDDWEPRIVSIPGLYVVACWLVGPEDSQEFIVLDPAPAFVREGQPYTWNELKDLLRTPARHKLETYQNPPIPR